MTSIDHLCAVSALFHSYFFFSLTYFLKIFIYCTLYYFHAAMATSKYYPHHPFHLCTCYFQQGNACMLIITFTGTETVWSEKLNMSSGKLYLSFINVSPHLSAMLTKWVLVDSINGFKTCCQQLYIHAQVTAVCSLITFTFLALGSLIRVLIRRQGSYCGGNKGLLKELGLWLFPNGKASLTSTQSSL